MTEPRISYRSLWLPDLLGLVVLVFVATVPFLSGSLDVRLQSLFHTPASATPWAWESWPLWRFLYRFGTWPALLVALVGLLVFALARRHPGLAPWRRHGLYLFLALALGPGLLVNTIFKDHWGRPRPRQTQDFGGRWEFQRILENGAPGRGKSFPCGHSSTGYYFVAFYFLLRRRRRALALAALAGSAAYGTLIGLARMAAGAHFASDVLWSAVFPAAAAFALYYVILRIPRHEDHPAAPAPARYPVAIGIGAAAMAAGALLSVMAATPVFREWHTTLPVPKGAHPTLQLDVARCDVELVFTEDSAHAVEIAGEAQGFGWPWARIRESFSAQAPTRDVIRLAVMPDKGFSELSGTLRIRLPAALAAAIEAGMQDNQVSLTVPEGAVLPSITFRLRQATLTVPPRLQSALLAQPATNGVQVLRLPGKP